MSKFWMIWNGNQKTHPTMVHTTLEAVNTEAQRLAGNHPGASFFVLEASHVFKTSAPPVVRLDLLDSSFTGLD